MHDVLMNFHQMFFQISNDWCCIGTVFLWARVFYPTMYSPLVLLQLTLVFEHLVAMLTEVNNFIVLLKHVILKRLPLSTFVLTVFAL